jgi:hypothetical protein
MSQQQNILFFSQNCQYSKKLIAKIINLPIYNNFQKICVDDPQTRSRLPKWVTCVPLIYLAQPHPSFQNPLKDNELWMWVEQLVSAQQQQQQPPQPVQFQPQTQQQLPPPQQQQQQQNSFGGIEPYNFAEMRGGISSDTYSLFNSENNGSSLFPHTYETVGGLSQNMGNGGGNMNNNNNVGGGGTSNMMGNGGTSRSSMKQEKFDQDFAMKKAMRDQDVGMAAQQPRKQEGLPENFNQMFEANYRR